MSEQTEVQRLLQHMDDEWPEDWDGNVIRAELIRLESLNAELLEALRNVCLQFLQRGVTVDPEHPDHVAMRAAEAAIAKAEGK